MKTYGMHQKLPTGCHKKGRRAGVRSTKMDIRGLRRTKFV